MKNSVLNFFFTCSLIMATLHAAAQEKSNLYNPEADAEKDIASAINKAKAENKQVLIQAGGNWCGWCIKFNKFCKADKQIDSVLKAAYVVYHLNYSKENENKNTFAKYGFPQRFGFPVLIILDGNGNRIHTQNTEYFESKNEDYNRNIVLSFMLSWTVEILNPELYK